MIYRKRKILTQSNISDRSSTLRLKLTPPFNNIMVLSEMYMRSSNGMVRTKTT